MATWFPKAADQREVKAISKSSRTRWKKSASPKRNVRNSEPAKVSIKSYSSKALKCPVESTSSKNEARYESRQSGTQEVLNSTQQSASELSMMRVLCYMRT